MHTPPFRRHALHQLSRVQLCAPSSSHSTVLRSTSTGTHTQSKSPAPTEALPETLSPRWLSDTKSRIGKCISFGLTASQITIAAKASRILGEEWRQIIAGSEGFLTGKNKAGMIRQGVVWGEMDSMQHVNNVTYVRYAESARVNWATNFGLHIDPERRKEWMELMTPKGVGLILKSIKVDYKFPMTYPDRVSVFHKIRHEPFASSHDACSFLLDVLILSERAQRPAARCFEDLVVYNYSEGRKAELPSWMVRAFKQLWNEQKREKIKQLGRAVQVERMVEELESQTWNKKGAVEDMGT